MSFSTRVGVDRIGPTGPGKLPKFSPRLWGWINCLPRKHSQEGVFPTCMGTDLITSRREE